MGTRQVEAPKKKEVKMNDKDVEKLFKRTKEATFSEQKKDKRVETLFGTIQGPPPKEKCVQLTNEQYLYQQSLTKQEKKKLPSRTDPSYPKELDRHRLMN